MSKAPKKFEAVLNHLRGRIVQGVYKPGEQLPQRHLLERQLNVRMQTLQKVFNRLKEQGFVTVRRSEGTYVSATPPHLCDYGMVFEWRPSPAEPWTSFWKTLQHEATSLRLPGVREVTTHFTAHGDAQDRDCQTLADQVRDHRFAGLIFTGPPHFLKPAMAAENADIPRVFILSPQAGQFPAVYVDLETFVINAAERLLANGRRRLAILTLDITREDSMAERLGQLLRRQGLSLPPCYAQSCHPGNMWAARNIVLALTQLKEPPDGLIVTDDNLVDHVSAALIAGSVRVPEDMDVVAHANFPLSGPGVLPFARLGFDCREILRRCIDVIDMQRRRETPSQVTYVEPVWAQESAWAAPSVGLTPAR